PGDPTGTTGATSEAATGSSGDDTTTGGPLPTCTPIEPQEFFELTLDPPLWDGAFDGECLVSDGIDAHVFTCGEQTIDLFLILTHQPIPLFKAGDTVQFSYRAQLAFDLREYFAIRSTEGELLLGGLAAETLTPPDEPAFFAPIELGSLAGVCAPPVECTQPFEQLKVRATLGNDTIELGAGEYGQIGDDPYDVSVSAAQKLHNPLPDGQGGFCSVTDVPEFFYRLLVRRVP
ncbi:MAG TPA: hypothetical protein VIK91_27290, partial [Nannocystis sp.]